MDLVKVVALAVSVVGVALICVVLGQELGGQWSTVSENLALVSAFLALFGIVVGFIYEARK